VPEEEVKVVKKVVEVEKKAVVKQEVKKELPKEEIK
jgi:hypothetical protein